MDGGGTLFTRHVSAHALQIFKDRRVLGLVVVPGASHVTLAACSCGGGASGRGVVLLRPLQVSDDVSQDTDVSLCMHAERLVPERLDSLNEPRVGVGGGGGAWVE